MANYLHPIEHPSRARDGMMRETAISFLAYLCIAAMFVARAQPNGNTRAGLDDRPTGARTITFTERDAQSSIQEQAKRFNWKMGWVKQQDSAGGEYELARESFRIFVPADYK